ncbi:MAG: hypothetical protein P4L58_02420, partial [Candidatus Pacebacteria bacterium]|nr:hypothetical protein [Candidatus Paceibacterota bacterium]
MTDNFPWYLSRASGLVGFILLYVSIFLGLAIRTPILKRIIKPVYSFRVHCWISFQALLFAFFHGAILLLDKFIGFSWQNIFIPFYPTSYSKAVDGDFLALGIIGFYL